MTTADYVALALFIFLWVALNWITSSASFFNRTSLTLAMNERRREWIYNSLRRDLKMIDTQILSGLQNGTGFFASTSIFAIGSCFALPGATDKINACFSDMPFIFNSGRTAFELQVAGLACLFGYERAAERVVRMNIIAARSFNAGLRAIFLSIGYLGWFLSPYVFMATTMFIIIVLIRRQFFSDARLAIMDNDMP